MNEISMHRNGIRRETVNLDGALASRFLERNDRNRPLLPSRLRSYSEQMKSGAWQYNPADPIVFAADGRLLNGQHRLEALIRAGVTLSFDVVHGADAGLFTVLDSGARRSAKDALAIAGIVPGHARSVGACARLLVQYASRGMLDRSLNPTNEQIIAVVERNHWIASSVAEGAGRRVGATAVGRSAPGMFVRGLTSQTGIAGDEFWRGVETGEELARGDVRLQLRTAWTHPSGGSPSKRVNAVAIGIKAWNYWTEGRRVGVLKFMSTEPFPDVAGYPPEAVVLGW